MNTKTKLLLIFIALGLLSAMSCTPCMGQARSTTSTIAASTTSQLSAFTANVNPTTMYAYLYVGGYVKMAYKNGFLLVVRDTSKLSIKVCDSVFILHISPKFVQKINDSTYTFKNH